MSHFDRITSRQIATAVIAVVGMLVVFEWSMGRTLLGPDGKFAIWEGDIWSAGCSQRIADAYAFSHIGHGIIFYAILWLLARRLPVRVRFFLAVLLEAGWELLENSPFIINRYREATMASGYCGDSILNSVSDLAMMSLGFLLAWKANPWASFAVFLVMEIGCALWIRDNLTLNVIMLLYPLEAIREWQIGGRAPSLN